VYVTPEAVARYQAQGLVNWRGACWVTPARARELEATYQEGRRREREALAAARNLRWPAL
jgi:hypothetical protein